MGTEEQWAQSISGHKGTKDISISEVLFSCTGTQGNSHCIFFVQDLLIMCDELFGLLYGLLCTVTRGQNQ